MEMENRFLIFARLSRNGDKKKNCNLMFVNYNGGGRG